MYTKMEKKLQKIFGKNVHINSVRFFESKKNQVTLINFSNKSLAPYPSEASGSGACPVPKRLASGSGRPVNKKIIMKTYVWGERKKEEEILKKLYELGISVPGVIKSEKDILFLEYIPGENLRILYNKEKNPYTKTAREYDGMVARWLGNFHKTLKNKVGACNPSTVRQAHHCAGSGQVGMPLLKGDMRLQNFILTSCFPHPSPVLSLSNGRGRIKEGGILYGVDFEESAYGAPEYDLAQLFAVFLTQIIKYPQKTMVAADFSLRKNKNDIKKHQKRIENFIKIYSETSGISVNKNIDKLIKQELVKITTYLPHLKDSIRGLASPEVISVKR